VTARLDPGGTVREMDKITGLGILFILLGLGLVRARTSISRKAAAFYQKLGISVPPDRYARQFAFVGVLMVVIGFLTITGMIHLL